MELHDAVIYGFPYKLRPKPKIARARGNLCITGLVCRMSLFIGLDYWTDLFAIKSQFYGDTFSCMLACKTWPIPF